MNFYEIGKWAGDRIGFPRVGLVNKETALIKDTFEFLTKLVERSRITIEIQKRHGVDVSKFKKELARKLNIPENEICVTENNYMRGKYIYRVFTQSRKLFKEFQFLTDNILASKDEDICKFLAGFADAEATIDTRNNIISFSISNKKTEESKRIKKSLERFLLVPIKIRNAGKLELKIEVPSMGVKVFNENIGKFMKRPEKLDRINGTFISNSDKEILNFIKENSTFRAKELANHLRIHGDSARRILRSFRRQGLIS